MYVLYVFVYLYAQGDQKKVLGPFKLQVYR